MNKSRIISNIIATIVAIFIIAAIAIGIYCCYNAIVVSKAPIELEDIHKSSNTVIYDRNGEVFEVIGNGNSKDTAEDFPLLLENAVIAIEDKRFYAHEGVDIIRTGKVVIDTITNGAFGAGGSTITQQLVKNVTGDDEISISRKVREMFYAMQLEQMCSKEQILTKYLNIIYLGKGNFGMVDACKAYFGKSPEELTLAEAAFMAAIIQSPETYINNMEMANERKNLVLEYMFDQQIISQSDYETAVDKYIEVNAKTSSGNIYSWFTEAALYEFATMLANTHNISYSDALERAMSGGYKIYSTVDPNMQNTVYNLGKNMNIGAQAATLVMNKSGQVIACSGGVGVKSMNLGFNRAVQARRQPGSAIKPLAVYGPALEENRISTLSVYTDREITYGNWTPQNFSKKFYGDMNVRKALAMSNNGIPVQILNEMGTNTGISYLKKMGFETEPEDNALTLALGAVSKGYTLPEMASGYQAILNGGTWCEPVFFTKIETYSGTEIYNEKMQDTSKVFSEDTAYILTDMLKGVVETDVGTATTLKTYGMDIAAKTGTTSNNRDKWCCAFNPEFIVVTWCGHDQGEYVNVTSSYIQNHIKSILMATPTTTKTFTMPTTVQKVEICSATGLLSNGKCESTYSEILKTSSTIDACTCEGTVIEEVEEWWNNVEEETSDVGNNIENFFNGILNIFGNNTNNNEDVSEEEYPEESSSYYEEETLTEESYENYEGYYDYY